MPRCRAAHCPDAPDPAQERSKGGTDLDSKIMEQYLSDAEIIDALGDHHRSEHGQSVRPRLLTEKLQP